MTAQRKISNTSYDSPVIGWDWLASHVSVLLNLSLQHETSKDTPFWLAGCETQPILKGESITKGLQANSPALTSITLLFKIMTLPFLTLQSLKTVWFFNVLLYVNRCSFEFWCDYKHMEPAFQWRDVTFKRWRHFGPTLYDVTSIVAQIKMSFLILGKLKLRCVIKLSF